jgi:hypothetical protein
MKQSLIFLMSVSSFFQTIFIYAGLDNSRAQLLVNHLDVIRELKTTFTVKQEGRFSSLKKQKIESQTDIHRKYSCLNKIINENWGQFLTDHKQFVDSIIECERQYTNDYYVFYHAQRQELRVFQDFLKEMYEFLKINKGLKDFHFLRFWHDMPVAADANSFIDENNKKGYWNDSEGGMQKILLSVNLALFGSCTEVAAGECTFDYFLKSRSIAYYDTISLFGEVFKFFDFDKKYISELANLQYMIKTQEGTLFQIFIPRKLIDKCGYLSRAFGIPYDKEVPGADFNVTLKRHKTISEPLNMYRQGPVPIKPISVKRYKNVRTKKIAIKSDDSNKAYVIDKMQARLIFSQDMMLNPDSGIKVYRYTTVSAPDMARYQMNLKEIAHNLFVDWLEHLQSNNKLKNTELWKVYKLLAER